MEKVMAIAKENEMEEFETKQKIWLAKFRNVVTILFLGFAMGTIVADYMFIYRIQKDCSTLKQFRIGDSAYMCMGR
jgi:hypothetical protein